MSETAAAVVGLLLGRWLEGIQGLQGIGSGIVIASLVGVPICGLLLAGRAYRAGDEVASIGYTMGAIAIVIIGFGTCLSG